MRNLPAAAQFADRFHQSDAVIDAARSLASEFHCAPLGATSTHVLSMLTRLARPASAIDVGTGTGVSAVTILSAMPPGGVLTTIDTDPQRQAVVPELFDVAGISRHRARMITGQSQNVLSRLAEKSYDLVFLDTDPVNHLEIFPMALSKLRAGGVIVVNNAMAAGAVANPADRSATTSATRRMLTYVSEVPNTERVLLPVDAGLLALIRAD
ncbi:putative O-methyltransferase YrrM [Brevibacterium paucivorans]|mgnify:FL=1|uniref:O-methyltransferase YrrM n=1 Tax=Brevibacterium paucivorans TaxID=170994 RepID=A0ABS2SKP9_9MICO|nr:class I SAM-dependent methyltransferase [uncultured Brevibacterium sp.]MBM7815606.1 putative O-methyltransferase YrrM [Brevibacterium paucivorans]